MELLRESWSESTNDFYAGYLYPQELCLFGNYFKTSNVKGRVKRVMDFIHWLAHPFATNKKKKIDVVVSNALYMYNKLLSDVCLELCKSRGCFYISSLLFVTRNNSHWVDLFVGQKHVVLSCREEFRIFVL